MGYTSLTHQSTKADLFRNLSVQPHLIHTKYPAHSLVSITLHGMMVLALTQVNSLLK